LNVTIVTVCFNAAATIGDTLSSVARQSMAGVDHIVIDGGSSDGTLSIVDRFPHVSRLVSERDRGIYDAMNKGLALASGDYIGFLNADDVFAADDSLTRFFAGDQCGLADIISGDVVMVDAATPDRIVRTYRGGRFSPWRLRIGDMPPHPATYVRTTVMRAVGGFRDDFRIAGDFDLLARLMLNHGASWAHRPVTLTAMRQPRPSRANQPRDRPRVKRSWCQNPSVGFACALSGQGSPVSRPSC
jgi:glycosyltransferase involved in cell wall biosynthesis